MIAVKEGNRYHKVHGVIKGYLFDDWYMIQFPIGNAGGINLIVQADNEQDVLDKIADSKYLHLIKADEDFVKEQSEEVSYFGNNGIACDISEVMASQLQKIKAENIKWFMKKDSIAYDGTLFTKEQMKI